MMQRLNYGRISWSYEEIDANSLSRPTPLFYLSPIHIRGRPHYPNIKDRELLRLFKLRGSKFMPFSEAYRIWRLQGPKEEEELGEARAYLRWVISKELTLTFRKRDLSLHPYFQSPGKREEDEKNDFMTELSFSIPTINLGDRKIKLYLQDDSVISLLNLDFGEEMDFLELVRLYIKKRLEWEKWRAPAPLFYEWVLNMGKRPIFKKGQLNYFCQAILVN
jgi:hypothetical protein